MRGLSAKFFLNQIWWRRREGAGDGAGCGWNEREGRAARSGPSGLCLPGGAQGVGWAEQSRAGGDGSALRFGCQLLRVSSLPFIELLS